MTYHKAVLKFKILDRSTSWAEIALTRPIIFKKLVTLIYFWTELRATDTRETTSYRETIIRLIPSDLHTNSYDTR